MSRLPWLGKLAPSVPVLMDGSATTLSACLRDGKALLLLRDERSDIDEVALRWTERLMVSHVVPGADVPAWLVGVDAALIRPDGHIAHISLTATPESGVAALSLALERWLGAGENSSAVARAAP
jgi:hypothetical protein